MTGRRTVGFRQLRVLGALAIGAALTWGGGVPDAHAASRSKGQLFVFDTPNCTGNGNSPMVTIPASVGGRDYPANISMDIYATDKATDERFGPFVVTTDAHGNFCRLVRRARATQWKIDLVEPGSGSTDSKVVTVLAPPAPTTTGAPTSTAAPTTTAVTTTTSAGTTTTGGTTTTTPAATTTTVGATTTAAATTTSVDAEGLPIEILPAPVPPEWSLPATGARTSAPIVWGACLLLAGSLLVTLVRRPRRA